MRGEPSGLKPEWIPVQAGTDSVFQMVLFRPECDKILKESIRFRAVKKEQLIQKISCSECDSFQLYQFAETLSIWG